MVTDDTEHVLGPDTGSAQYLKSVIDREWRKTQRGESNRRESERHRVGVHS